LAISFCVLAAFSDPTLKTSMNKAVRRRGRLRSTTFLELKKAHRLESLCHKNKSESVTKNKF
jgi:hypothetical protein